MLEFIRQENLPLATYLTQADLKVVDDNTLEWDFKGNSFHLGLLEGNGNKKKLEKLCQNFFKRKIKIRFLSSEPQKNNRNGVVSQEKSRKNSFKEKLSDPRIKDLIDIFQADVVDLKMPPEKG